MKIFADIFNRHTHQENGILYSMRQPDDNNIQSVKHDASNQVDIWTMLANILPKTKEEVAQHVPANLADLSFDRMKVTRKIRFPSLVEKKNSSFMRYLPHIISIVVFIICLHQFFKQHIDSSWSVFSTISLLLVLTSASNAALGWQNIKRKVYHHQPFLV